MSKLNQVLAVEKGVKSRNFADITHIDRTLQQPAVLQGITRTYQPREDGADAEQLPPEAKFVQVLTTDALDLASKKWAEMFDVTATKEWANMSATANIEIDGTTILADVPVTYLLFLEKQLNDIRTFISRLPLLDPAHEWTWDANKRCYVTTAIKTFRTKKVPRVIVKYDATPEHPAQTEIFHEDQIVGEWETIHMSGAIPAERRTDMLEKTQQLLDAVKTAREAANDKNASQQKVGETLLAFVFGDE